MSLNRPALRAADLARPPPAAPRRGQRCPGEGGSGAETPGTCWLGAPGSAAPLAGRLLAPATPCVDSRGGGGQSLSGFPTPGQTRSVWELLATGPALRAPGTGSPPFPPPWGGGHGAGGETGHSQTDQTEEGPDSRGEGKIPDGKNKGVNPGKEGCEIPPAPGLGR